MHDIIPVQSLWESENHYVCSGTRTWRKDRYSILRWSDRLLLWSISFWWLCLSRECWAAGAAVLIESSVGRPMRRDRLVQEGPAGTEPVCPEGGRGSSATPWTTSVWDVWTVIRASCQIMLDKNKSCAGSHWASTPSSLMVSQNFSLCPEASQEAEGQRKRLK